MTRLSTSQRFWIAVLVIAGYLGFGIGTFLLEGSAIVANTVLATMGPLVGWVVKGLFDAPRDEAVEAAVDKLPPPTGEARS